MKCFESKEQVFQGVAMYRYFELIFFFCIVLKPKEVHSDLLKRLTPSSHSNTCTAHSNTSTDETRVCFSHHRVRYNGKLI